jgi:hypothetical protein
VAAEAGGALLALKESGNVRLLIETSSADDAKDVLTAVAAAKTLAAAATEEAALIKPLVQSWA